jgi:hypothetical protein
VNIVLSVYVPTVFITAFGKFTVDVVEPRALKVPVAQFCTPEPTDHA